MTQEQRTIVMLAAAGAGLLSVAVVAALAPNEVVEKVTKIVYTGLRIVLDDLVED